MDKLNVAAGLGTFVTLLVIELFLIALSHANLERLLAFIAMVPLMSSAMVYLWGVTEHPRL